MQIAASRSTKAILREAKIVPLVALNCLPQARHFHLRRVGMAVGLGAAAGRAERLAAVLRKADRGERLERLIVGHAVHVAELEGPGGGGEEEVLGHCHHIRCLCIRYDDTQSPCQVLSHRIR